MTVRGFHVIVLLGLAIAGCQIGVVVERDPFDDAEVVSIDQSLQSRPGNLFGLGELTAGSALLIDVNADTEDMFVLLRDTGSSETESEASTSVGLIVDGTSMNENLEFVAPLDGEYFLFLRYSPDTGEVTRRADILVSSMDETTDRPAQQLVRVAFEPGFLSDPGLWDPVDGTDADRDFLASIEEVVAEQIRERISQILAGTPIVLLAEDDEGGDQPVSTVTFSPERVTTDVENAIDATMAAPDPNREFCQELVMFGEVLPSGTRTDTGNRSHDDEAVVYVGSFQGRGAACQTAIINSIGNIALSLAQTAAHEIGHLVGLHHVEQIDLMNRGATIASFRELEFARGQIQFDELRNGEIVTSVFTELVQDPDVYLLSIFGVGE